MADKVKLKVGEKAPELGIPDQDGKVVNLKDFKGKKLILYFYPKDLTPGCTDQSCDLRDHYSFWGKSGYAVVGVSIDDEKKHQKFIEKYDLPFPLLADTDKELVNRYGVWGEKSMYGKKYFGIFRTTFIIDGQGVIEHIIEKVKTKNHSQQITEEFLSELVDK